MFFTSLLTFRCVQMAVPAAVPQTCPTISRRYRCPRTALAWNRPRPRALWDRDLATNIWVCNGLSPRCLRNTIKTKLVSRVLNIESNNYTIFTWEFFERLLGGVYQSELHTPQKDNEAVFFFTKYSNACSFKPFFFSIMFITVPSDQKCFIIVLRRLGRKKGLMEGFLL